MKFLCITLGQGEVCTDDANADVDTGCRCQQQWTKLDCIGSLVDKPNEQKIIIFFAITQVTSAKS